MKAIAGILASGIGTRMKSSVPKQFLNIGDVPVIIHTIKNILNSNVFDEVIIVIHKEWDNYLKDLLVIHKINTQKINIITGGAERIDSIENLINSTTKYYENDIVVICDAVRPFITTKILSDSVKYAKEKGAVVATIPIVDSLFDVNNNKKILQVKNRENIVIGQAPDSFQIGILSKAIKSLTENERKNITSTAQICVVKDIPVYCIEGDKNNIKITTQEDIDFANYLLKKDIKK